MCSLIPPLAELSEKCEKLVDEEVRRALYGVKQMKEVMWKNEQKHEHLMKSLKHSSDKKKVRATLRRPAGAEVYKQKRFPSLPPGSSPIGKGGD